MAKKIDRDKIQEESRNSGGIYQPEKDSVSEETMDLSNKSREKTVTTLKKPVVNTDKRPGENVEKSSGPVGLDIGTSHIVAAQNSRNYVSAIQDLNAFFTVTNAKFAKEILSQKKIKFYENSSLNTNHTFNVGELKYAYKTFNYLFRYTTTY